MKLIISKGITDTDKNIQIKRANNETIGYVYENKFITETAIIYPNEIDKIYMLINDFTFQYNKL